MITEIEGTLFTDPQARIPAGYCPVCGGALYGTEENCLRCERRSHDPDGVECVL